MTNGGPARVASPSGQAAIAVDPGTGHAIGGATPLPRLADDFAAAVEDFAKARDAAALDRLRDVRLQLAELLLTAAIPAASALAVPFTTIATACLKPDLRSLVRTPAEDELFVRCRKALVTAIDDHVAARGLAAVMLASYPFELEAVPPLLPIPPEMRPAWLALLLQMPAAYVHRGDAERFVRYLGQLCERLRQYLRGTAGGPVADVANAFFGSSAFMQAYFNELNLRDVMRRRGAIIEDLLTRGGAALDELRVMRPCGRRPRIGFICLNVGDGTEGVYLAAHMERLNRNRFDIRLYSIGAPKGKIAALCRAAAETFVQLPAQVPAAVARLRRDDLDIALFSNNMTAVPHMLAQIAAHRVARLQGDTGASPVTTGLRNMDLMFSGEPNETENSPAHYTEQLVRTTGALNCYPFHYVLEGLPQPDAISRSAHGIPDEAVVYFSAANFYKILPELSELWLRILAQSPNSYLMLMPFNPNWSRDYPVTSFHLRLHRQLAETGVSTDRLRLHPPVPTIAHLHRVMEIADIYLDAFPFSGACSIYDALAVGLPVVARAGSVCRSRHSKAILEEAGLADWIVTDDASYARRALELARDTQKRAAARERLAQARRDGLKMLDTTRYASMLMTSFDEVVSDWNKRVGTLHTETPAALARRVAALVPTAAAELGPFSDRDLIIQIVLPYLRSGGSRRLIDIGGCVGAMSKPFLAEGWQTVMFEPDQRCHPTLAALTEAHPGQVRIEHAVVTPDRDGSVSFHIAGSPGLSGMSRSPFAADLAVVEVRAFAIAPYIARHGLFDVDFIKIDAEGHDLAILDGINFRSVAPRVVMVEFLDDFPGQDRGAVEAALQRMRDRGYQACVICLRALGDRALHQWDTGLLAIGLDAVPSLPAGASLFGNILFFREDDRDFLPSIVDWLEQIDDRKRRGLSPLR